MGQKEFQAAAHPRRSDCFSSCLCVWTAGNASTQSYLGASPQTGCQICEHRSPHAEQQPQRLCDGTTKTFSLISFPAFCCIWHSAMCAPSVLPRAGRTSRRADVHLFLCFSPPSDRRRYEAGTGLRVSAALRAPWRRVELQTLCFRPHTSHTLHAGGGDDQLVVVCMTFLPFL